MKVRPLNDPDRGIELQESLDDMIMRMEAKLNEAGFSTREVLTAFNEVLANRWKAYKEDPDPADDPT